MIALRGSVDVSAVTTYARDACAWQGYSAGPTLTDVVGHLARRFDPTPENASVARQFVANAVRGSRIDQTDAVLVTSELVTNAIKHAKTAFEVQVHIDDADSVRIAVVNHAPELLLFASEPSAEGGRGLALIDTLATAWGFERHADVKLVWVLFASIAPER